MHLDPIEVADLLGIGRSTYYSWESGERAPRSEDLPRIAEMLGTSVGALYGEPTPSPTPVAP
jgi:transcriptional regulator with XRE-family HTH domain